MAKQYISIVMEMLHMTKKGFGILDILVLLLIVSSLTLVSISNFRKPDFEYIYLTNNILKSHTNSLINKEYNYIDNWGIYFNENGNINKAQTINFKNKKIILHLGNGYLLYE